MSKLCKDCKHYRLSDDFHDNEYLRAKWAQCATIVDEVNGWPKYHCKTLRETEGSCGSEGRSWEAQDADN